MATVTVNLYNGNSFTLEGDLSIDQIRSVISSAGIANVNGSNAAEEVTDGARTVSFEAPRAATKG